MKNTQMNIRDIEKWQDDYYPKKEKFKKKKPRKKDVDTADKVITIKRNKK
jgi:hypothetical protein|tara:strand:- start:171 stop:320 length:150 start_codon:yes stop_codon:yes gene_type:complete